MHLSFASLYPTNWRCISKVYNMTRTARFLELFLHMWNCLNIKSTEFYIMLNDQNRRPFSDFSDERLTFLQDIASMFKQMDTYSPSTSVWKLGLTSYGSYVLHITLMVFLYHPKQQASNKHKKCFNSRMIESKENLAFAESWAGVTSISPFDKFWIICHYIEWKFSVV